MPLRDEVNRLGASATDLSQVRRALDGLLRRRIGYDIAAISTTDPATGLWTSCYVSGLPEASAAERENVLFDIEFHHRDVNSYAELSRAAVPVGRLHDATSGDLERAMRYAALLRDLDVIDELRAVLRAGDACWGTLTLYRTGAAAPFSPADAAGVAACAPAIADLIRLALLRSALDADSGMEEPPGLLLVAPDATIIQRSAAADEWLRAVDDRGRIPSAVRSVVAAAAAHGVGRANLPSRTGRWLVLHGAPLATGDVSVIIEGARPAVLSEFIAQAYGFTPREREVTALAAQGRTTQQIATALGISAFTVQDHLKAVFAKAHVQSRGELIATIFLGQYRSKWETNATPSPYGWYLDEHAHAAT